MAQEKVILERGDKIISLYYTPFDAEVDMDDLTAIQYWNLQGEILTIATLMNRVGVLQADANKAVREAKLAHRMLEAKKGEHFRRALITEVNNKTKLPTVAQIEDAVATDAEVHASELRYINLQRQQEVMDSLYWAVKSKEMKLGQMGANLTPDDLQKDLLESAVNGVMIKVSEKKF